MKAAISELGLTSEQTRILFSMQYLLIENDIQGHERKKTEKKKWLQEWTESINNYLRGIDKQTYKPITIARSRLISEILDIINTVNMSNKTPIYLILLELTLFTPYYPLAGAKMATRLRYRRDKEYLEGMAVELGIGSEYVDKYLSGYKKAVQGITGFWPKIIGGALVGAILLAVTAGLAAPLLGALFAPIGLSGAAATSAGLAALGGGAIAAGGAGMAGGIATIVAGGALLGVGSGLGVGKLLSSSPKFTLSEAAKLEVVMREITLTAQKDVRLAQEIILEQRNTLKMLDDRLFELQQEEDENKDQIKTLKKSISHLRHAIERNRKYALGKSND